MSAGPTKSPSIPSIAAIASAASTPSGSSICASTTVSSSCASTSGMVFDPCPAQRVDPAKPRPP